jgi:hypothetical protein
MYHESLSMLILLTLNTSFLVQQRITAQALAQQQLRHRAAHVHRSSDSSSNKATPAYTYIQESHLIELLVHQHNSVDAVTAAILVEAVEKQ